MAAPVPPLIPKIGGGLGDALFGMAMPMQQLMAAGDNIARYGTPGHQRVVTFQTALCEHLGPYAMRTTVSQDHGRMRRSGFPLDIAINSDGYLYRQTGDGEVEATRDGRMRLDADGFLVSVDHRKILSATGQPIQFPYIPNDLEQQVKIAPDGELILYDGRTGVRDFVTRLGVFNADGKLYGQPDIKQNYVEDANINLQQEFLQMMPLRRSFATNRQMFIMQNDALTRMLQTLGQPQ